MPEPVNAPGSLVGFDLTVPDAPRVRDFYADVLGWSAHPVSMGDYDDYQMRLPGGAPAGGICHARGVNADLPPQWMLYLAVDDLPAALAKVTAGGGEVVRPANGDGPGGFAVVRDPAGAHLALMQNPALTPGAHAGP